MKSPKALTTTRLRIWDFPTRLVHWTLLILIGLAWWSVSVHNLDLHRTCGALIAGILVFRLWWGLFGASTARFDQFLKGPGQVIAYARHLFSRTEPSAGHNPMGGWSVAALLAVLVSIVGSGLFAVDVDGLESGPLSGQISFEMGRTASRLHGILFDGLKVLVVVHLVAIAFYAAFKRENLVRAMLDGRKTLAKTALPVAPAPLWALLTGLGIGTAVTSTILYLSN